MGFFSSSKNKPQDNDPWLTNLIDEDAIPLAELEAATNPFVAPTGEEAADVSDAWHFPEVDLSVAPMTVTPLVPHPEAENPPFGAAPFADEIGFNYDESNLNLSPMNYEADPNLELWGTDPSAFGDQLGDHLDAMPESNDRRSELDPSAVGGIGGVSSPTRQARHVGPVGNRAVPLLEAFGLDAGATWTEVRDRFLEMRDATEQQDETDAIVAAELNGFRRDINATYASLRLLAAA